MWQRKLQRRVPVRRWDVEPTNRDHRDYVPGRDCDHNPRRLHLSRACQQG
jgi:hypothetical protein